MKTILRFSKHWFGPPLCFLVLIGFSAQSKAQSPLSLQGAIDRALASRADLAAEADRVSIARGSEKQARLIANPTFQFENQNLRPGQTYSRDVDTYAYFSQPLDILGKRKQRIAVASQNVASSQAEYDLARRDILEEVQRSYWEARGAQEIREILKATVENFRAIVDYHSAQFTAGAIPEQDLLRIRLESERLQIDANLAVIEATRTQVELQRQMGEIEFPEVVLSQPLDSNGSGIGPLDIQQVLEQRVEVRLAKAAFEEAQAKVKLEGVAARPDLSIVYGLKRTQLVDSNVGTNTALAGFQITLPITDRNQGNRDAAAAEVHRREQLLMQAEAAVRADYFGAVQEYNLRRHEIADTLQPLREHGATISEIAQQAYQQGGTDLLRLLDAQRASLDAELAWVKGMVQYQESVVSLQAAEGVSP